LLNQFRKCKELARLSLAGMTRADSSLGMVFGTVVHGFLQHYYNAIQQNVVTARMVGTESSIRDYVMEELGRVHATWLAENPRADARTLEYLELTMAMAEATMPMYCRYWREDFEKQWIAQEQEFTLPHRSADPRLADRPTFLRGKIDGAFLESHGDRPWLFETKTKVRIEEGNLADIMPYELQVNIYLRALMGGALHAAYRNTVPGGVLYNIIRRPGLRQKQNESVKAFAQRMIADVRSRLDWYFIRMTMVVTQEDFDRFDGELHDTIDDFLLWWYGLGPHYRNSDNCENKFGTCHMLEWCSHRNQAPYFIRSTVFRELEEI
jgi:hypothetical protein